MTFSWRVVHLERWGSSCEKTAGKSDKSKKVHSNALCVWAANFRGRHSRYIPPHSCAPLTTFITAFVLFSLCQQPLPLFVFTHANHLKLSSLQLFSSNCYSFSNQLLASTLIHPVHTTALQQIPVTLTSGTSQSRKWMDEWIEREILFLMGEDN